MGNIVQKKEYPFVSIVIPAYNEEASIARTLETVKKQDYKGLHEIIVVDNNSSDATSSIANDYGVMVISEHKKGSRFAYQRGMQEAKGEIILVTNADTLVPENWISSIVNIYLEDQSVVGVGTKVNFYQAPAIVNFIMDLCFYINPLPSFWGQSMSCKKEFFEKVGGIDHGYNTNEDGIFGLLLQEHGKIKLLKDISVYSSGRRYQGNPIEVIYNWVNGVGGNSMAIQFNYLFFKRIRGAIRNFKDVR